MSYIGNSPGVASQRVTTTLTATAGQTQFTTQSGYVLGYVDVYLNGAKLVNGSDFEAITGTYITLFAGALAGDVVELISYVPRGLSDGYTKAEADAKFLDVGGDTASGSLALATASLSGALTLSGGTAGGVGYLNGSKVLTTDSGLTFDGSALTLGGTTPFIRANMSGTQSTRLGIQNSTANGNTRFFLYPNGTGNISAINGWNNSNPAATDYQSFDLGVISTIDVRLSSSASGSASYLPLTFWNGGSEKMRIASNGDVSVGTTLSSGYKSIFTSTSAGSVTNVLAVHNGNNYSSSGTGARLLFKLSNFEDAIEQNKYASIEGIGVSAYNEDTALVFRTQSTGNRGNLPTEKMRIDYAGWLTFLNTSGFRVSGIKASGFGYSPTSYGALVLGAPVGGGNTTVCIGVDPVGNTNGAFSGWGGEVMFRNGASFLTPNTANTGYHTNVLVLKDGNVGIGGVTAPAYTLDIMARFRVGDGTNSLVAGYWDGSTNRIESTGKPLFLTSYADSIRFGMSGSENMRITSTGSLAFANTNTYAIIRRTNVTGSNGIRIQANTADSIDDSNAGASIMIGGGVIGDTYEGNVDINAYGSIVDSNRNQIRFNNRSGTNATQERMRINHIGNVGIGTTTPGGDMPWASPTLDIQGSRGSLVLRTTSSSGIATLRFKGPDANANDDWHINMGAGTNSTLTFSPKAGGGATGLVLRNDGTVGAGTTTTAPTSATKFIVGGGTWNRPTYSSSLSAGGNFMFNLFTHCGNSTFRAGTIKVLGTENQVNQTYAVYDFAMARYVHDGSGAINYHVRLTQRSRVQINNGYGNVFLYLSNYASSWTTTDQAANNGTSTVSGSTSIFDVYARNEVGQACSVSISIEFMDI